MTSAFAITVSATIALIAVIVRQAGKMEYDYIIVGAGTAGCVIAHRLSEDAGVRVLVLEAGRSDLDEPRIEIPNVAPFLVGTMVDWNYTTIPQKNSHINVPDRRDIWPRGKVTGGSSSLNYQNYNRGSPHDYDSWEDYGAKGWNWKSVEAYFRKLENATMDGMSQKLGRDGPLKLIRNYVRTTHFYEMIKQAAKEVGIDAVDYTDNLEGFSHVTRTVFNGSRQNSAEAYLKQGRSKRRGTMRLVTDSHVTRILFDTSQGSPRAYGVRYKKGGIEMVAQAKREIIICAGAIGSPQLLMLSGIGPIDHLRSLGIETMVDSPGVGSNLQDHVVYKNRFRSDLIKQAESKTEDELWESTMMHIHYKTRFSGSEKSLSTAKRPFPEIQFFIWKPPVPSQEFLFEFYVVLNHAKSAGTIKLKSANPEDYPYIDPKYYSNQDDLELVVEGFRLIEGFENSSAFKENGVKFLPPDFCNGSLNTMAPRSDAFYRCNVRQTYLTAFHPCCTVKMGLAQDEDAVLDPQLRVRGVRRLRVADASVMPHITSSNLQGPCYMIGEKAADMIKQYWKEKTKK